MGGGSLGVVPGPEDIVFFFFPGPYRICPTSERRLPRRVGSAANVPQGRPLGGLVLQIDNTVNLSQVEQALCS